MAEVNKEQKAEVKGEDSVMDAVQAKIDAMLAAAEEKANAIIEAAKKDAEAVKPEGAARVFFEDGNDPLEEYVTVKLFKDNGRYQDDVFVAVNGEGCSIPRGVPVMIKRKFALQLEQSDLQDFKTAKYMEAEADKFAEATKKLNL